MRQLVLVAAATVASAFSTLPVAERESSAGPPQRMTYAGAVGDASTGVCTDTAQCFNGDLCTTKWTKYEGHGIAYGAVSRPGLKMKEGSATGYKVYARGSDRSQGPRLYYNDIGDCKAACALFQGYAADDNDDEYPLGAPVNCVAFVDYPDEDPPYCYLKSKTARFSNSKTADRDVYIKETTCGRVEQLQSDKADLEAENEQLQSDKADLEAENEQLQSDKAQLQAGISNWYVPNAALDAARINDLKAEKEQLKSNACTAPNTCKAPVNYWDSALCRCAHGNAHCQYCNAMLNPDGTSQCD